MSTTRSILAAFHTRDTGCGIPDTELLRRFSDTRDEFAFETLVHRHARLVWGVCHRVLGHMQEAEDAFQATFLVLARNPEKPRQWGNVAGFLFGVARRVALKARKKLKVHSVQLPAALTVPSPDPSAIVAVHELQAILEEEIERLPETYRLAFLLCVQYGKSRAEAAMELNVSEGTLSAKLARARLLLRDRLAKRGIQLTLALAIADLRSVSASQGLARATVEAVMRGRHTSAVLTLAHGTGAKLTLSTVIGLVVCMAVAVGLAVGDLPPRPNVQFDTPEKATVNATEVASDTNGDSLPAGAVARLGSARWRHEGDAQSMSFSPDGKVLAVLSREENVISFFDTATGKVLHRLTSPEDRFHDSHGIAFSPDGSVFASWIASGVVQLRDARTFKLISSCIPPPDDNNGGSPNPICNPLCFSPDGKRLAFWSGTPVVTVWDVTQGKCLSRLSGHNHVNAPLAFSPDGNVVFLGVSNPNVQLWDAATGKFIRGFETNESLWCLAVSADGGTIATGANDRIVLSDVKTGKAMTHLNAKMGQVHSLAFTPNGEVLVSAADDAKVRVWDLAKKKERFVLDSNGLTGRSMALSADGKTVAVGTTYNVVRLWDVTTGKDTSAQVDGHDATVQAVAISPDGKTFVTGGANNQIRIWDATTLRNLQTFHGYSPRQVSFSPDGLQFATARNRTNGISLWEMRSGKEIMTLAGAGDDRTPCASFIPDRKTIVSTSWRRGGAGENFGKTMLRTWNGTIGNQISELTLADLEPHALAISPDGKWAAVGGYAGNGRDPATAVRLCDLSRNQERPVRCGDQSFVVSVAFSMDNRLLAAGSIDRQTRVFEVSTGREVMLLGGHARSVSAVAFMPNHRVLATADGGPVSRFWQGRRPQIICFWDVVSGKEIARLDGHASDVTSLAFTPDGRRFITGLKNGTALVWETPTAARSLTFASGRKLGPRELTALWADLAGDDARVAHEAVGILAASPDQSVPFLAKLIQPEAKLDVVKIRQWITDLKDEDFKKRETASFELTQSGEDIAEELQKGLVGNPSPEAVRRLTSILKSVVNSPPPARLQILRGVWVLELIGTPAAKDVLMGIAKGDPNARLTREAKAAIDRK